MFYKSIVLLSALSFLLSCSDDKQEKGDKEQVNLQPEGACLDASTSYRGALLKKRAQFNKSTDFGQGDDGALYVGYGETFRLEEREYNFSSVYTENGSVLTVSDDYVDGAGSIRINALGACSFLGEVDLSEYGGSVDINCYDSILIGQEFNHPHARTTLTTVDASIYSDEVSLSISEEAALSGSIDISAGELTLPQGSLSIDGTAISILPHDIVPQGELTIRGVSIDLSDTLFLNGITIQAGHEVTSFQVDDLVLQEHFIREENNTRIDDTCIVNK